MTEVDQLKKCAKGSHNPTVTSGGQKRCITCNATWDECAACGSKGRMSESANGRRCNGCGATYPKPRQIVMSAPQAAARASHFIVNTERIGSATGPVGTFVDGERAR